MTKGSEHPDPQGATAGLQATVVANLANGMFRLQTSDGRELTAHVALDLRMALARLLPGDLVQIEVSPFDQHRARICRRLDSTRATHRSATSHATAQHPPQQRELS